MGDMATDLSRYAAPAGKITYPTNCIVGIVPVDEAGPLIGAVKAMGIADDAIEVITPDRLDDFELQLAGGGIRGAVHRLVSDAGGDLDLARGITRELQPGRLGVRVRVGRDEDLRYRVGAAYGEHRSLQVHFLGRNSIETLNGQHLG